RQVLTQEVKPVPRRNNEAYVRIHSRLTVLKASQACESGLFSELLFDPQELVVLGNTIGPASRSGLDLAGIGGDCQVCDKCILGFTGTMGNHIGVPVS